MAGWYGKALFMFSFVRNCQCGALSEPLFPKASHSLAFSAVCCRPQLISFAPGCSDWLTALNVFDKCLPHGHSLLWANSELDTTQKATPKGNTFSLDLQKLFDRSGQTASVLWEQGPVCSLPHQEPPREGGCCLQNHCWAGEWGSGGGSFTFLLISVCLVAVNLSIFHSSDKVDCFHCFYAGMGGKFLN